MVKLTLQLKLQRYSKLDKCLEVRGSKLIVQEISNNLILKSFNRIKEIEDCRFIYNFSENYSKIYAVRQVKMLIFFYELI